MELQGPQRLKLIKGFHDEALSGDWKGFRSSRLGIKWRVIYHVKDGALKTLRELQEMSQSELAAASGISQSNISAMENETRSIGRERALKLALALKVHPSVILFPDFDVNKIAS